MEKDFQSWEEKENKRQSVTVINQSLICCAILLLAFLFYLSLLFSFFLFFLRLCFRGDESDSSESSMILEREQNEEKSGFKECDTVTWPAWTTAWHYSLAHSFSPSLTDISAAAASLSPASPAPSSLSLALYAQGGRTSHPRSPSRCRTPPWAGRSSAGWRRRERVSQSHCGGGKQLDLKTKETSRTEVLTDTSLDVSFIFIFLIRSAKIKVCVMFSLLIYSSNICKRSY